MGNLKTILFFFILIFLNTSLKSQTYPNINGSWSFKYLEINEKEKTWELESDIFFFDYLNIHFMGIDTLIYMIDCTCFNEFGFYNVTNSSLTLIPDMGELYKHNNKTNFRKNISNVINFLNGTCEYSISKDSVLSICKKDSCFVFFKFNE